MGFVLQECAGSFSAILSRGTGVCLQSGTHTSCQVGQKFHLPQVPVQPIHEVFMWGKSFIFHKCPYNPSTKLWVKSYLPKVSIQPICEVVTWVRSFIFRKCPYNLSTKLSHGSKVFKKLSIYLLREKLLREKVIKCLSLQF